MYYLFFGLMVIHEVAYRWSQASTFHRPIERARARTHTHTHTHTHTYLHIVNEILYAIKQLLCGNYVRFLGFVVHNMCSSG